MEKVMMKGILSLIFHKKSDNEKDPLEVLCFH